MVAVGVLMDFLLLFSYMLQETLSYHYQLFLIYPCKLVIFQIIGNLPLLCLYSRKVLLAILVIIGLSLLLALHVS